MLPVVAVTYRASPSERAILNAALDGTAEPVYLTDLDNADALARLSQARAVIGWNPFRELDGAGWIAAEHLELVQLLSAGAEHVDYDRLSGGVAVAANVGAYAEAMAEHAVAMMLALAKNLLPRDADLQEGRFEQWMLNTRVGGSVAAIVGYGGIGQATARLLRPFGTRIIAVNRSGRTEDPVLRATTLADLSSVLAESDIVVLSLPHTPVTDKLIGAEELAAMKEETILVNVARGAIIDEHALYAHASTHARFRVGIDAWWFEPFGGHRFHTETPLLALPNVLGSPHNSAMVPGAIEEGVRRAAANLARHFAGEPLVGLIDPAAYRWPETR